jgi:2-keto-4-pentenoate hydratase
MRRNRNHTRAAFGFDRPAKVAARRLSAATREFSIKARIASVLLCAGPWFCFAAEPVQQLADDYFARRPMIVASPEMSMPAALRVQEQFVARLSGKLGKPVGYKVGLVTKEAQQKYGVTSPVRGVLLAQMMLTNYSELGIDYGVRPILEADLVAIVGDGAINRAAAPVDVLRHLKEIVAFIELPDNLLATNQRVTGALLTAVNVGARYGVLGERVPVRANTALVEALGKMEITLSDGTGKQHAKERGEMILGNPVQAVLWLIEDLRRAGKQLHPGEILSLGAVKAITPNPGQTYTVRYDGLPGGPISVSVRIR